jgi:2-polyprenyl-6-methoxyphenol hydroxylase-like FAD-dependent oxidoreductase
VRLVRVAVAGAGLAGLATAAALRRAGHEVAVFEQAGTLRSGGLAINLWSNATSLLPALGLPAGQIPGQPFSRMLMRGGGRAVTSMALPARGLPHVTVERAELLTALAGLLPDRAISYGTRIGDVSALAGEHDLVVVADGASSSLRPAVTGPAGRRWTWTIWQATVAAELPQVPADAGASVVRTGLFGGVWRLPGERITWFVAQPERPPGDGGALLAELREDEDPVLRTLARATAPERWTEWRTADLWPSRTWHRGNVVLVGDAAHAMLPTLGQGACQSIEDTAALAGAVAAEGGLDQALRRYAAIRVPRVRRILALARVGALSMRSSPASRAMPATMAARLMARSGGPALRRITRPRPPTGAAPG